MTQLVECIPNFSEARRPEAVEQIVAAAASVAEISILDRSSDTDHNGDRPRIGGTDVVPFVPLSGVTMDGCVAIAKRLGERVGRELNIPVYLYEAAAQRPDRTNLEVIRKGQF